MSEKQLEERTQWVYDERTFPIWNASFDKTDRTEMIREDLWAGRSIAILLAALVATGLVLALVTLARPAGGIARDPQEAFVLCGRPGRRGGRRPAPPRFGGHRRRGGGKAGKEGRGGQTRNAGHGTQGEGGPWSARQRLASAHVKPGGAGRAGVFLQHTRDRRACHPSRGRHGKPAQTEQSANFRQLDSPAGPIPKEQSASAEDRLLLPRTHKRWSRTCGSLVWRPRSTWS